MANSYLSTYLNDHMTGSEAALKLLGHFETEHAGTAIAIFAAELRGEIEGERGKLEELMAGIGVARSVPRKAAGWLGEKMADLKLRLEDPGGGPLRLLEILEALSLGIEGKRGLWLALEAASDVDLELRVLDYAALRHQAEAQRSGVETLRLEAAKAAFRSKPVAEKG